MSPGLTASQGGSQRLRDLSPQLERLLTWSDELPCQFSDSDIRRKTVWMTTRDGIRLATDLYLPPILPAPVIVRRAPYGRASEKIVGAFLSFARHGFVVASQDVRGTGDSEPDHWDYYMYEPEDGYDFVAWVTRQQWCDGFVSSCGGSYDGQTQWCMAMHPKMSTIAAEVSGLGIAFNTSRLHMTLNAYARAVGKGEGRVPSVHYTELEKQMLRETLASGYFNEPLRREFPEALLSKYPQARTMTHAEAQRFLWEQYCSLNGAQRAAFVNQALGTQRVTVVEVESLPALFGQRISHDAHTLPHPRPAQLCKLLQAPPLMITGWYDWSLNDALATWDLLMREAREPVASQARLIIGPNAHNVPGYHEGMSEHPELQHNHRVANHVGLLLHWYEAVRQRTTDAWPKVIYYLMGANEWWAAGEWPPPEVQRTPLYLGADARLAPDPQSHAGFDRYTYDPLHPTPTVGGSIVSAVYPPGSVDVSEVQRRQDIVVYTTSTLERDLDVVGPIRLTLFVSSSATDTDFSARLSDVFPDGRAIQLQSGMLRARHRSDDPQLITPNEVYCLEIDMWATANRFRRGHRLRLDICSADFPRFDRNSNRGGECGAPVAAVQTIYYGERYPSHLLLPVLGTQMCWSPQTRR